MTNPAISVVICSHNSRKDHLRRTLESIAAQSLAPEAIDLVVVDNASSSPPDLAPTPWARLVPEPALGLTNARLCGFREARASLVVMVDDDNVLMPGYLETALNLMQQNPGWGTLGGRNEAEYETPPPDWLHRTGIGVLACRNPGPERLTASWADAEWKARFPWFSPVGAGMVLRREVARQYIEELRSNPHRPAFDRVGKALTSGGDNDIVLTSLAKGWQTAYDPALHLLHLIGTSRLTLEYQARLHRGCNRSWALLLAMHGISPWPAVAPWTVPLRQARAWWRTKPWTSPERHIRFHALCGLFEGRADAHRLLPRRPAIAP